MPAGVLLGVSNQIVIGANAALTGGGQVLGDVLVTAGTLAPPSAAAPSALQVGGALTAQPAATVKVVLGSASAPGRLAVAGTASLSGTLDVTAGAAPNALDAYQVMTFGAHAGHFDHYVNLDVPGPLTLAPLYSATDLRLVATLPGDATLDGAVNFNDLVSLAQNYNTTLAAGVDNGWQVGDFTGDGRVDFEDLVKLAQNYNTSAVGAPAAAGPAGFDGDVAAAFATVPEPSALCALAALSVAYALGARRRRQA